MTNRLRNASFAMALACACESGEDPEDTGTASVTTVSTTAPPTTTAPGTASESATGEESSSDDGDVSVTADPTEDPTADPTADPTEDPTEDPSGSSDEGAVEESGGPVGFSISGNASRAAEGAISPGDDGVGTLYVGVLLACDQNAESIGGTSVLGANMSQVGSPVPFTIEGLPNGTYYIAGFLDDDVNADPSDPYADMGDIAFAEGFGIGCVEVVIAEADASGADFAVNINVPF